MEKKQKIGIAIGVFVVAIVTALVLFPVKGQSLGGRLTQAEKTLFTTTTNANYAGIPVVNVNDFQYVGVTFSGTATSGTLRMACSTQDDMPTIGAASSTENRWDYVDMIDTETESSINGDTGITFINSTDVRHFVVRNSIFKWCAPMLSGNTSKPGLGTTTIYMKVNQGV